MKNILPYISTILLTVLLGIQYFQYNKLVNTSQKLQAIERAVDYNRKVASSIEIPEIDYSKVSDDLSPLIEEINNRVTRNSSKLNKLDKTVHTSLELIGQGQTDSSVVKAISLLSYQLATMPRDTQDCFQFRTFNYQDSTLTADIDVYMDNDEGYLSMDYSVDAGDVYTDFYYPKKRYFSFTRPKPSTRVFLTNPAAHLNTATVGYENPLKLRFMLGLGITPGVAYVDGRWRMVTTAGIMMGFPLVKYYAH